MTDDSRVNVDVKGWITGILKHCPESGSTNLATHEEEEKLKHRCWIVWRFLPRPPLKTRRVAVTSEVRVVDNLGSPALRLGESTRRPDNKSSASPIC